MEGSAAVGERGDGGRVGGGGKGGGGEEGRRGGIYGFNIEEHGRLAYGGGECEIIVCISGISWLVHTLHIHERSGRSPLCFCDRRKAQV